MNDKNIEEKAIINAPEKIYLQIGCKDYDCTIDFNELSSVTWNKDQIDSDDIEYIKSDTLTKYKEMLREIVEHTDKMIVSKNDLEYNMASVYRSKAIDKAKQLLTDK